MNVYYCVQVILSLSSNQNQLLYVAVPFQTSSYKLDDSLSGRRILLLLYFECVKRRSKSNTQKMFERKIKKM